MPGIQLPIGIDTVNPVDADFKRGPWASIPAALAGINIALRYNNLSFYVVGDPNEYYWLDTDLTDGGLLTRSTGGASIIYITRVALQALIAGSTLQEGAYYAITDFQDKDTTDTDSRVIVMATSANTISQTGFWKRLTQNKAYGAFALSAGVAGSVDQITVGGVTLLMTASVPYTTSRINTANLVAANINANSGVSGYRAIVIAGEPVIDRPVIVVESNTAGVNTSSLAVSVTTLTVANLVNLTKGVVQAEQTLDIAYDIVADRIINCYDAQYGVTMKYTTTQIATLGYNPIVNWRWGHSTFRNWTINGTSYRNFFDFPATSGVHTLTENNNLSLGVFENIVTRRASSFLGGFSYNTSSLSFSNVQLLSSGVINSNTCPVVLTNVTGAGTNNSISNNKGDFVNRVAVFPQNPRISITNISSPSNISLTHNSVAGQITLGGVYTSSISITLNIIEGSIANTNTSTYSQSVSIASNVVTGAFTIPSGTVNAIININNNIIQSNVFTTSLGISVGGFTIAISNCTFAKSANTYSFGFTSVGNITMNEVQFQKGFTLTGVLTSFSVVRSNWIGTGGTFNTSAFTSVISLTDSTLDRFTFVSSGSLYARTMILLRSTIKNVTSGTNPNFNLTDSEIVDSTMITSALSAGIITMVNSYIRGGSRILLNDVNKQADVSMTKCQMNNADFNLYGTSTGNTFVFTNSIFTNTIIDTNDQINGLLNFSIIDSVFENSKLARLGISNSPVTTDIARCNITNSTLWQQNNAFYSLYDCEVGYSIITANDGGNSFTFQKCVFEYQDNLDFTSATGENYDISDMTIIKNRGLYKANFTFDGGAGSGQVGVPCIVLPDMLGQQMTPFSTFTAIITKATISTISGLSSGGGSLDMTSSGGATYIGATSVATLNADYQAKNEPTGVANDSAFKYDIRTTPTIADITAGTAEFAIEFLIAP